MCSKQRRIFSTRRKSCEKIADQYGIDVKHVGKRPPWFHRSLVQSQLIVFYRQMPYFKNVFSLVFSPQRWIFTTVFSESMYKPTVQNTVFSIHTFYEMSVVMINQLCRCSILWTDSMSDLIINKKLMPDNMLQTGATAPHCTLLLFYWLLLFIFYYYCYFLLFYFIITLYIY